jgi:hypothetical protein
MADESTFVGCERQSGVEPPHSKRGWPRLHEAIVAGGEEVEEAQVAEDLQLLADFVADVEILGMKSC